MKKLRNILCTVMFFSLFAGTAAAGPDQFMGDSNIYSGGSAFVPPNVLIILNNSSNMADQSAGTEPYDSTQTYAGPYKKYGVYFRNNPTSPWQLKVDTVGGTAGGALKVTCGGTDPVGAKELLLANGFWKGGLDSAGACSTKNNDQKDFFLGNLINKLESTPVTPDWTANTHYDVGDLVHPVGDTSVTYRAAYDFGFVNGTETSCGSEPSWSTDPTVGTLDCGIMWYRTASIFETTKIVISQVISSLREKLNVGIMAFGRNNDGGGLYLEVKSTSVTTTAGQDHYKEFMALLEEEGTSSTVALSSGNKTVEGIPTVASNTHEPISSAMYDASLYFRGQGASTDRVGQDPTGIVLPSPIPSPIAYSCQKNFVIVLTTGASAPTANGVNAITDLVPLPVKDGIVDPRDAAYLLHETDHSSTINEMQRVQTSIVQFLTQSQDLLEAASPSYGNGTYVMASSTEALEEALRNMMLNFVKQADTAFVAPVVPASPENRTFSGKRIYLGFFKPQSQKPWLGNLKKFGLDKDNNIVSNKLLNGAPAPATNSDGSFKSTARSYWSNVDDAGSVVQGGVGGKLKARTVARNIYTYLGSSNNLTHSSNAFNTTNITAGMLGLPDTSLQLTAGDASDLIGFSIGNDTFDDDADPLTTKREWLLGDLLHSKPLVVSYSTYQFTDANEADCSINKTVIYVGTNDGMLHAFNDCNGEERWAFIPPDLIEDLKYQRGSAHTYFVDSSPVLYYHDHDNDGIGIGPNSNKDIALLLFSTRRGRGHDRMLPWTSPRGALYAINVTNPNAPTYIGKIDSLKYENSNYPYWTLAEMWSVPRIVKITHGGVDKFVAIFGGGYHNAEDYRWGNTMFYPFGYHEHDSLFEPAMSPIVNDFIEGSSYKSGTPASTDPAGPFGYPKNSPYYPLPYAYFYGSGVYVVEIASLDENIVNGRKEYSPNTANIGTLLWKFDFNDSGYMRYSIPSDIAPFDSNYDGRVDRFYVGDVGGQLWRFDIGDRTGQITTAHWSGERLFKADVSGDTGRKIFHRPDMVPLNNNTTLVYFGTGDRAHPLNYLNAGTNGGAVIDRVYMIRDSNTDANPNAPTSASPITEASLVDLTTNPLQREDTTQTQYEALWKQLYNYNYHAIDNPTPKYGWFIKLNYPGGADAEAKHWGEKSLSSPLIIGGKMFFTTYQPEAFDPTADPCDPGNLGIARLYAVDARTGEAVYNYYAGTGTDQYGENQSTTAKENAQGKDGDGNSYVLRRADRELTMGTGIPSKPTIVVTPNGEIDLFSTLGTHFEKTELGATDLIYPVFWMNW